MNKNKKSIDAVLPLIAGDLGRFRLLAESMEQNFRDLGTCWVVIPDHEAMEMVPEILRWRGFEPLMESALIPEVAMYRRLPERYAQRIKGWYVQQLIKFAIANRVETRFYLTLDADVVCARPVHYEDLIRNDRAIVKVDRATPDNDVHADWYTWAERVLGSGYKRSGLTHGVTPAILNRDAVFLLQDFLERRVSLPLQATGEMVRSVDPILSRCLSGWQGFLVRAIPWTEYSLYHTFLEGKELASQFHQYGDRRSLYTGIWSEDQVEGPWEELSGDAYFYVPQSNIGMDVDMVRRRLTQEARVVLAQTA